MITGILSKIAHLVWPFSNVDAGKDNASKTPSQKTAIHSQNNVSQTFNSHHEELRTKFYEAVFLCEDIDTDALSVPENLVLQVVEGKLKSPDYRTGAIPRLPTVVPQLLKSLRDPNSSASQYVEIIKQDPVVASAVLKMANSAYYNPGRKQIDSFQRAVVMLGLEGMRSLLSSAVMQPIIQCKSPYFLHFGKKLWDHSSCCAITCQILAKEQGMEPFKAYLAGLVHDIGAITIFTVLTKQFKLTAKETTPPAHAFVKLMNHMAADLSYWISNDWGFPDDILVGLKDQIRVSENRKMSKIGQILFLANQASETYMLVKNETFTEQEGAMMLEELNMTPNLFEQLDQLYIDYTE